MIHFLLAKYNLSYLFLHFGVKNDKVLDGICEAHPMTYVNLKWFGKALNTHECCLKWQTHLQKVIFDDFRSVIITLWISSRDHQETTLNENDNLKMITLKWTGCIQVKNII